MKLLILGASGMLGYTLFKHFNSLNGFTTIGTIRTKNYLSQYYNKQELNNTYDNIDADNFDSVVDIFDNFKPNFVINCIGIIKQLKEANDFNTCLNINALFPHKLANLAKKYDAKVIHISTDCVFNGKKGNYLEDDIPDAYDLYGKTKFLGELHYTNSLTLRTSIIGHELNKSVSLVDWFLSQQNEVQGYTNAIYSGFPTIELAEIIEKYILHNNKLNGLYHVSSLPINKYELLKIISEVYHKKVKIIPYDNFVIDRSLNSDKFKKITGYNPPSWHDMVIKMYNNYKV